MRKTLAIVIIGLVLVALLAACAPAGPSKVAFPTKTITWIVPASPGGGLDTVARGMGSAMPQYFPGEAGGVVVKNVSQPMGIRGLEVLWQSAADGYTILNNYVDGSILQQLRVKPTWDFPKYSFIGQSYLSPFSVSVLKTSPYNSIQDLVKSGQTLRWGVITGDSQHLFTVLTIEDTGIKSAYVGGYPGTRDIAVAMLRGEVDVMLNTVPITASFVSSGDMKMLMTLHEAGKVKGIPTATELGYPRLDTLVSTQVLLAPPGVPKDIVAVLETALQKTIADPDVQIWAGKVGYPLTFKPAADVAKIVNDSFTLYEKYFPSLEATVKK